MIASALLTTGALAFGAVPAGAASQQICTLLPALCPPTTAKPPAVTTATTKAPAKASPTAAPPAHSATPAHGATPAPNAPAKAAAPPVPAAGGRLSLGVGAAGILAAPTIDPAALGQPLSAPELAGTGTAADGSTTTSSPPSGGPEPAALGIATGGGRPNRHAAVRVVLSLVALGIAGLAAAQLPVSRRRRRSVPTVVGLDIIDGL